MIRAKIQCNKSRSEKIRIFSHKKIYLIMTLLIFTLTACSEEAQPYKETNDTLSIAKEQGYIETH